MALPCDMLDEILCRLPVKLLLRCRCVSKEWCSLIDSTRFVKKHLKKALDYNASGLIINGHGKFYLAENYEFNLDGGGGGGDVVVVEINDRSCSFPKAEPEMNMSQIHYSIQALKF